MPPPRGLGRRALERLGLSIYPGEGRLTAILAVSFFLCLTFQYICKTIRQSTFVDALGASRLPYVYFLVALLSYPAARLYAHLLNRWSQIRLIVATAGLTAAGLLGFWWLFGYPWPWVSLVFYVWISIVIALTLSQLWSLSSQLLDPRQAKRLFGLLGASALLGGIVGGLVARFTAELATTRHSLLVAAVLLAGIMVLVGRLDSGPAPVDSPEEAALGGLAVVRRTPQLRFIALLVLAVIVASQIIDLQFNWAVESATSGLDDRTVFFGNFFSLMGVAAFAFQLLLTTRIHRLLGVGFALRVLPVSLGLGTFGLFLAAALLPSALVTVALALKIAESGLRYSVDDSTRELLFLPVPAEDRTKAKTFLDVFVKRAGKGVAAVLLFPVTLHWMSPLQAGWLSLAILALWLALTSRVTREYVSSFRRGLRQKSVDGATAINLADVTTLEILVQSLGSTDPRQVLHSLDLLATHGRGHLVPPLLLYHDDAEVRCRTLQILAEEGRGDAAPLVERRLSDQSPEVRAEATRVLADLRHQDACEMMLPRLRSADPGVRAAAIACLASHGDEEMRALAESALDDMATDAEGGVRIEAARALGALGEPQCAPLLVQMLYDPEPRVVRAAIQGIERRAQRDGANAIYLPTLISLLANRRLKHDARQALAAFGEQAIPALLLFMNEPDEPLWVRRAIPKTLASIPSPAAPGALVDSLERPTDVFLRAKLLEALDSVPVDAGDTVRRERVRHEIQVEAQRYLGTLADLHALDPAAAGAVDRCEQGGREPHDRPLLARLLAERAASHRKNLFRLLAVLYDRGPIWDAYRSLQQPALRPHALEFLDCTLLGDDKRAAMSAIGDAPLDDKLERAERFYGITRRSRLAALLALLAPGDERSGDLPFLAVGAAYTIHAEGIRELYPAVESLRATASDPFVLETANWVIEQRARLQKGPQS